MDETLTRGWFHYRGRLVFNTRSVHSDLDLVVSGLPLRESPAVIVVKAERAAP
jgi:hypothetical protein